MKMIKRIEVRSVLGIVLVLFSTSAFAGLFGPSDYDECIIDAMQGVTSDNAANYISHSCEKKFPRNFEVKPECLLLTKAELEKTTGKGRVSESGYLKLDLYNGNAFDLKDLEVEVSWSGDYPTRIYELSSSSYGLMTGEWYSTKSVTSATAFILIPPADSGIHVFLLFLPGSDLNPSLF